MFLYWFCLFLSIVYCKSQTVPVGQNCEFARTKQYERLSEAALPLAEVFATIQKENEKVLDLYFGIDSSLVKFVTTPTSRSKLIAACSEEWVDENTKKRCLLTVMGTVGGKDPDTLMLNVKAPKHEVLQLTVYSLTKVSELCLANARKGTIQLAKVAFQNAVKNDPFTEWVARNRTGLPPFMVEVVLEPYHNSKTGKGFTATLQFFSPNHANYLHKHTSVNVINQAALNDLVKTSSTIGGVVNALRPLAFLLADVPDDIVTKVATFVAKAAEGTKEAKEPQLQLFTSLYNKIIPNVKVHGILDIQKFTPREYWPLVSPEQIIIISKNKPPSTFGALYLSPASIVGKLSVTPMRYARASTGLRSSVAPYSGLAKKFQPPSEVWPTKSKTTK